MEVKYTVITVDQDGREQVQLYRVSKSHKDAYERIWDIGYDPSRMTDLKIQRELVK